ncbi:hypothetical protein M407DRAFT_18033 [Tulasnella calospora MUT 4182]|uniref:CxC2-like cysteine cluster KDZ transposase-associated domain-containing protein n=1 Tax=Tulasnella calospora MUT 4182 TaxID=1051891 RepID=A0A0C3QWE4_9AGAM|nr:hypothetical protein M407DRAFT_18033 [Tulasnella calospora MUT 4182]
MVEMHQNLPFHWPEAWVDGSGAGIDPNVWGQEIPLHFGYFKRTSLYDLGLQVGLGHDGLFCPTSHEADTFTMRVLHTSGQHEVRFRTCGCTEKPRWEQLLDVDIWPATELKPQTGFTMEVLRHQRCFSLRGKTSLKEYYDALVDLTSPAEHKDGIPSLYNQFRLAVRQYRVLAMYMRAGKPNGSTPVQKGELCVKCPACPEPGVNLPRNWDLDRMKQLHYVRFLAGDGNFKLQRLAKRGSSTSAGTKSLLGDSGFWVPNSTIKHYLAETSMAADEPLNQKKSACNTMAGDPGYSPEGAKALDVTGIFAVSCRHIFICPNGVVDFHKGEKYRYVDVCFSGPLNHSYAAGLRYFVITYDIACKYGVNFKSRCCTPTCNFVLIPTEKGEINTIFCVNKFHQESHEDGCAAKNALEYTKYVGRTCGEGVETIWAKMNWLRYTTREMSPGHRIETLSEHFNDWNWQKTSNLVRFTKSSYLSAVQSLDVVIEDFENLKNSLGPNTVAQLDACYQASGGEQFLQDSQRLLNLSRQELLSETQAIKSSAIAAQESPSTSRVSHIDLICKALQLEAMQARLRQRAHDLAKIKNPTRELRARVAQLANQVSAALDNHYDLLFEVAPQLAPLVQRSSDPAKDDIFLPSRLSPEDVLQRRVSDLLKVEMQLRIGHAYDCIKELRNALAMRSFWSRHTNSQHSSETKKTKGMSSLQSSTARMKEAARAYNTCYEWIAKCSPESAKKFGLHPLLNSDLSLLTEWQESKVYRRKNNRLPWIWSLRPLAPSDLPDVDKDWEDIATESQEEPNHLDNVVESWRTEIVRLDYIHATAATERWTEEVRILSREMPAICRSFRAMALRWARLANETITAQSSGAGVSTSLSEWSLVDAETRGYVAYASRQFALYVQMTTDATSQFSEVVGAKRWIELWSAPCRDDLVAHTV